MDLSQEDKNIFNGVKHVSIDFDGVLMAYLFNGNCDFPSYDFTVSSKPLVLIKSLLQKSSALLDNIFRKPIPDSKNCILKFREKGIKVSLLTSRGHTMEGLTKSWLKSQGLFDLFDSFYFAELNEQGVGHKVDMVKSKSIDLHIDDRPHAIENLSKAFPSKKFIYFNHHSIEIPSSSNVYKVSSWEEIEKLF